MIYDVFISHASEDKEGVARPLARHLEALGLRVWLDECVLTLGDSLRRKIDAGLAQSTFGVVVLSPAFFAKEWPNKELDGLVAREDGGNKVVLPVWHNLSASEVALYSPLLAGKIGVSTSRGLSHVASSVHQAIMHSTTSETSAESRLVSIEGERLASIRRSMLTSNSSREIRRSTYELEDHLNRYPSSVEARELNDQLKFALRRAEAQEGLDIVHYRSRSSQSSDIWTRSHSRGIFRLVAVGLVVGILIYVALKLLGVL